jgi:preprotein translocase subunit SecB|tara:strand:- start:5202 stop:5621 length:420 start_codon:yes stop_codon:yes gene_type:complete
MNYKIVGKYIKELNFNIPNPKTFFLLSKDIANYKINIDINSKQAKENFIEVLTSLKLSPTNKDFETINTKIIFSTIIEIEGNNLSKEELEKIILIEVPSKIYPELRKIFIFLFENSGFKDVKINETVDFQNLYKMKKIQ